MQCVFCTYNTSQLGVPSVWTAQFKCLLRVVRQFIHLNYVSIFKYSPSALTLTLNSPLLYGTGKYAPKCLAVRGDKVGLIFLEFKFSVFICQSHALICLANCIQKRLAFGVKEPKWQHKIIALDRKCQWVLEATERTPRVRTAEHIIVEPMAAFSREMPLSLPSQTTYGGTAAFIYCFDENVECGTVSSVKTCSRN